MPDNPSVIDTSSILTKSINASDIINSYFSIRFFHHPGATRFFCIPNKWTLEFIFYVLNRHIAHSLHPENHFFSSTNRTLHYEEKNDTHKQ